MHIKKIILNGFKTFPDKTIINLNPGVTVISGPNGVGKSNIYDALKWVTGEQSRKTLRTANAEDVIFYGSDSRSQNSFAEVSLLLTDSVPVFNTEVNELSISRRLFSTGESEYFINGIKCRLKDITHLFLDTGIGHDFYSFISQGNISHLIECKPEERREIFEEAASIMKYRSNKVETIRKLEKTKIDMQRIADIISEIGNQLSFLKKQVRQAERFNKIKMHLIDTHNRILEQQYLRLSLENEDKLREISQISDNINAARGVVSNYETNISSLKFELSRLEEKNTDVLYQLSEIDKNISRTEAGINGNNDKIAFYEDEEEKLLRKNKEEGEKILQYTNLNIRLAEEVKHLKGELLSISKELNKARETFSTYDEKLSEFSAEQDIEQRSALKLYEDLSNSKSKLNDTKRHLSYLISNKNDIENQFAFTEDKVKFLKKEVATARKELSQLTERNADWLARKDEKTQTLRTIQEKHEKLSKDNEHISKEIYAQRQTLGNIHTMIKNMDGYSRGVKFVLQKGYSGVIDIVANLIAIEPKYELSIELLLANKLQNIVISDITKGAPIIEDLKSAKAGRVTFIPLRNIKYKNTVRTPGIDSLILGYAIDLVKTAQKYENLKNYLFFNSVIVKDMDSAIAVSKKIRVGYYIITLDGDIIYPNNVLTGGYRRRETFGILNREHKAQVLEKELSKKLDRFNETKNAINEINTKQKTMEDAITIYSKNIEDNERMSRVYSERSRTYTEQLDEQTVFLKQKKDKIITISNDARKVGAELQELTAQYSDIERAYTSKKEELNKFKDNFLSIRNDTQKIKENIDALLSKKMTITSKITADKNAIEQNKNFIESANRDLSNVSENIRNNRDLVRSLTLEIKQAQDKLKENIHRREGIETGRRGISNRRNTIQISLSDTESKIKEQNKKTEKLNDRKNSLLLANNALQMKINILLSDLKRSEPDMRSLNITQLDDSMLEELVHKRERYEKNLQNIGPVNPGVVQEYTTVGERYEFLINQRNDIEVSRESLLKIIRQINKKIRTLFTETFEQIRENFKINFKMFFSGGTADLKLIDDTDILETGIEIYAKPPGKKLKRITGMSGGEKALTSLALVFAIFMKKASPFCVLDEVDAPLDDFNGQKFTEIIDNYKKNTQFIVISHKKTTIAAADVIYGVTMEENGISKLVSVKFNKRQVRV